MNPWNERYADGTLPWDTGRPDAELIRALEAGEIEGQRVLELGCGTGTNAVWLASRGHVVTAVDIAELAVERARERAADAGVELRLAVLDILKHALPAGPYDIVFDRGCFHVFDEPADREQFARQIAGVLAPDGRWLSLIGSTEGAARETGPPRRSARDICDAIEPHLAVLDLRLGLMDGGQGSAVAAWRCIAGARAMPAQASTRR